MIGLVVKDLFVVGSGWNGLRQRCRSASVALGAAACLALGALGTMPVSALGLGEIDTRSALNERFAAEIELLDTRGLDAAEVLASLASTDDFRRVGVERFFFLTSLKFDVTRNPRGNLVIKASSLQPITEPYLNFLVEVLWPSGRLLKEYTVLLDPPTFTHSAAAPVATPSREQTDVASAGRIQRDSAPVSSPSTQSSSQPVAAPAGRSRPATPSPRLTSDDSTYGRTTRNDTMWAIANQTLPSSNVTPQQNMLAIQRLNPTAFIDGNVNLLKAGVVLRLPSESEVAAVSNSSAMAEIDQQNQAWRAGTPGAPASTTSATASTNVETGPATSSPEPTAATIDATTRGPGDAGSEPVKNDGRLRIVSAEDTGTVAEAETAGTSTETTAVAGDPAARERLTDLSRQVDELTYQLDLQKRGVEEQISAREKTISLKDQQIAQLEAQLKAIRENALNTQQQDQNTSPATQAEVTPWWQQTPVLGAVLGGLALLLAGVLLNRRRQSANDLDIGDIDSAEPNFELAPSIATDSVTPVADAELLGDLDDPESVLGGGDGLIVESEQSDELSDDDLFGPAADAEPVSAAADSAQTSDVIGEADIYIAYGRYPQAIALLQGAVETNPDDHAVRMRLLEVSAETKDADSYAVHSRALREHCADADVLATADALHGALDADFLNEIEGLDGAGDSNAAHLAGAGAAVIGSAIADDSEDSLLQDELLADEDDLVDDLVTAEVPSLDSAEPFAFDTTVDTEEIGEDAEALLSGEFAAVAVEDDGNLNDFELDGEFELDLDTDTSADLDELTAEIAADGGTDFDAPSVNTDQFATNVDMDLVGETAETVDDFELDLDIGGIDSASPESAQESDLGGDLGLDFPAETAELDSIVSDTDDDELLDEIERSLDELEADGLLTPELSEEGDFSFDDDADTSATKLDLARAYIDMGDDDGAREILSEVISEGDNTQKGEANELLDKL